MCIRDSSTGVFPDADLQKRLSESGVTFSAVAPQENSTLMNFRCV